MCFHNFQSRTQVKLLHAAVDQLAADGVAMFDRLKRQAGGPDATTADVMRAAGQAAGAAAAQLAMEHGQEAGGGSAAAAKAATVLLEAAGVMAPGAQLQDLPPAADSAAGASSQPSSSRAASQQQRVHTAQQQQQQEPPGASGTRADTAGRAAAELSSMQVLVLLPYAEVICFADVLDSSDPDMATSRTGHRCVGKLCCAAVPALLGQQAAPKLQCNTAVSSSMLPRCKGIAQG